MIVHIARGHSATRRTRSLGRCQEAAQARSRPTFGTGSPPIVPQCCKKSRRTRDRQEGRALTQPEALSGGGSANGLRRR